jgi:hypothetical protein
MGWQLRRTLRREVRGRLLERERWDDWMKNGEDIRTKKQVMSLEEFKAQYPGVAEQCSNDPDFTKVVAQQYKSYSDS